MNEAIVNERIFDTLFALAVADDFQQRMRALPSDEQINVSFSPAFDLKMKQLIRKNSRQAVLSKALLFGKRAAVFFLVLVTVGFGAMMTVDAFRAAVVNIIVEWAGDHFKIGWQSGGTTDAPSEAADEPLVKPAYVPDGYTETSTVTQGQWTYVVYSNSSESSLVFSQAAEMADRGINVDSEAVELSHEQIDDVDVTVLKARKGEGDSAVIFGKKGKIYRISGEIDTSELLKMAKSMILK